MTEKKIVKNPTLEPGDVDRLRSLLLAKDGQTTDELVAAAAEGDDGLPRRRARGAPSVLKHKGEAAHRTEEENGKPTTRWFAREPTVSVGDEAVFADLDGEGL